MIVNHEEFASVIALSAPERYEHSIRRVAGSMELRGLRSSGEAYE